MPNTRRKQTVVIVGGQFAGRRTRLMLKAHFDVRLIDSKSFFEYTPSVLRCLVHPEHAHGIVQPQPGDAVTGLVKSITTKAGKQQCFFLLQKLLHI